MCEQCSKSFRSGSDLVSHRRTHSGDKPLVCSQPLCGKSFAHVSNLRVHERGHAGDRPHACPFPSCTKAFRHTSSRDDHFVAVHQGLRQYVCGLCARDFTAASNLKRHQKTCAPLHAARSALAADVSRAQAQAMAVHAAAAAAAAAAAGGGGAGGDADEDADEDEDEDAGGGGAGTLSHSEAILASMAQHHSRQLGGPPPSS